MQQEQKSLSQEDQTYYFRQICTYGEHYMAKITDLKIFIYGLRGLGVETAKCMILSGVHSLTIQDDSLLEMKDLGSNAYCREEDVGKKTRAAASIDLLRALNPRVKVHQINETEVTERLLTEHDVVIFTDYYDKKKLIRYNKICRTQDKPIGFIYGGVLGLYGFVFVDFGKEFEVGEVDSEEAKRNVIENIRKEGWDELEIELEERCEFGKGDYVRFQEVEGMTKLNGQVHQVHSVKNRKFTIRIGCESETYGDYFHNGYVIQTKMPQTVQFDDFETSLNSADFASFLEADLSKFGQSEKLHQCLKGILDFYELHQRLPEPHNAQEYYSICQGLNNEEHIPFSITRYAQAQLSSHCSFFGGIIAQEALKITGKFMPLKQWLHYETFEMIPQGISDQIIGPVASRFDDQIAIFGQEFQQNLMNQKILLIGAGTNGCELMKQFALMGIGCGESGKLTCVDSETIKPSNLSRQSLFKEKDIGRPKCQVACEAILSINPLMKVKPKKVRIGSSEEKSWKCDEFWEDYDLVVCAVDNLKARLEVDKKCILYQKPMLECGMSGAKASSQIIIPFKSQTYGESDDPSDNSSIPLDKLVNFPSTMEDCIVRARDIIEQEFCSTTQYFIDFQKNPQQFIERMKEEMDGIYSSPFPYELKALEKIIYYSSNITQDTCLQYAIQLFDDFFYTRIKKILAHFPPDHKGHEGQLFWNSRRRCPQPIVFDPEDEMHASFILAAANLYAKMFDLPLFTDKFAAALRAKNLTPFRSKVAHDEVSAHEFIRILESRDLSSYPAVKSVEYSRENKIQSDLITATSIIRARNYSITELPAYKINMIAGRFSPALVTTATIITGALSFEAFQLNLTHEIAWMRNTYVNLEVPFVLFSEPAEPKKTTDKEYNPVFMGPTKVFPAEFTAWDMIDIQGPMTILEIVEYFMKKYGLKLTMIALSSTLLYNTFLAQGQNFFSVVPEEAYNLKSTVKEDFDGSKFLLLEASAEGPDDETEILIPTIRYIRK